MRLLSKEIILITGAAGGIGKSLIKVLVERGVSKIYATGLEIPPLNLLQTKYPDVVIPLYLDVTDPVSVARCHQLSMDTTVLINNAGVEFATRFIGKKSLQAAELEMKVNYHGVHHLCSTYWSTLLNHPSPSIVNMLSVASFTHIPQIATYCASKAAAHMLTRSLRAEAISTPLNVYGVYPGYVDTPMTKNIKDVEKVTPEQIAIATCDGIEAGTLDIFPDKMSQEYAHLIQLPVLPDVLSQPMSSNATSRMFTPVEKPSAHENSVSVNRDFQA